MSNYSTLDAYALTGVSQKQIEYWIKNGWIDASVKKSTGTGSRRIWSDLDLLALKVLASLSEDRHAAKIVPAVWEAIHLYPDADFLLVGNAMAMPVTAEHVPMMLSGHPSATVMSVVCVEAYRSALFPEDVPA